MAAGTLGAIHAQAPLARRVCDPSNSEKVTVAAIAADPAAFMGKCVQRRGDLFRERLYADADAIYGVNASAIGGMSTGGVMLAGRGMERSRGAWLIARRRRMIC